MVFIGPIFHNTTETCLKSVGHGQEIINKFRLEADVNILVVLVEQLEASLRDQWMDIVRTPMQRLPAMPAQLLIYKCFTQHGIKK